MVESIVTLFVIFGLYLLAKPVGYAIGYAIGKLKKMSSNVADLLKRNSGTKFWNFIALMLILISLVWFFIWVALLLPFLWPIYLVFLIGWFLSFHKSA